MRTIIITQDEPFAVPILLEELLSRKADHVLAIAVAPPTSKRESFLQLLRRWWGAFGPAAFARYVLAYARAKLRGPSVKSVARRHGVGVMPAPEVNAPEFLQMLRETEVDLVVSVACPQIFRGELLKLPAEGCINVHSGPLPRYRGQLPTFWVLFNREPATAVTVHFMNDRLDDGPIILQERVPISDNETQASLMRRCKRIGGRLLAQAIELLEAGQVTTLPNPSDHATYYSFPTPAQARQFRAEGGRWL
jgi:methionyl-tRNA formyltransferase